MKRFIIGGLSLLLVSAMVAPAVKAQRQTAASPISSEQIVHSLSVVNLVEFGYRGEFSDRGIPGYSKFVTAVNTGEVTAEDLVAAAIADGRLPESAMDDSVFLYRVERNMLRVTDHDN